MENADRHEAPKMCLCGCGAALVRVNQQYASDTCRKRWQRAQERLPAVLDRAGPEPEVYPEPSLCLCGCEAEVHGSSQFASESCRLKFQRAAGSGLVKVDKARDIAKVVEKEESGCEHAPRYFVTLGKRRYRCGQCGATVRWEGRRARRLDKEGNWHDIDDLRLIVESPGPAPPKGPCTHQVTIASTDAMHRGQRYCLDCRTYAAS